MYRKVKLINKW